MCLNLKVIEEKIAEEDIICYKMIEQSIDTLEYRSFYEYVKVVLGVTYYSHIEVIWKTIEKGLHSYANKEEVIEDSRDSHVISGYKGVIVKCIIPKGSIYYEGTFCSYSSYASNCIKYTEEIIHYF